ncbi:MAG: PD-(D/E)XK nuclease family protein [Pseudomonadota bacterium]
MFEGRRVFGLAPGVDFPAGLVAGLEARMGGAAPEDWARITLIVNTRRMARRLRDIFDAGPPRLLPRILLVTELSALAPSGTQAPTRSGLRRRLDLMALMQQLLAQDKGFAQHGSLFDLTDSLAALFDEMEAEGVAPEAVANLDVTDQSQHWARTQAFLGIARDYLDQLGPERDVGAQARATIEAVITGWRAEPPEHPVILAGSTGSRGAVLDLMEAVTRLPHGAVVLPGYDFCLPDHGWDAMTSEDHPQYRFLHLARKLGQTRPEVGVWSETEPVPTLRNEVISLALRPAPATDAWLDEGPRLGDLSAALDGVTWVTAESSRDEAHAIALRLRQAAEDAQSAALISPDRMLTRQVTAALDQWGVVPDDSAGLPLQLTAPGRLVRHVARLFGGPLDAEGLLTVLKHPLVASAAEVRGAHQQQVQALELKIRDKGLPFPDRAGLVALSEDAGWAGWVADVLCDLAFSGTRRLADWTTAHRAALEALGNGHGGTSSALWLQLPGIAVRDVMDNIAAEADGGPKLSAQDYAELVDGLLMAAEPVRDRDKPYPGIMIWGTIEARVQGADLVILGGMNDGTWPSAPPPDPWLNRRMRQEAGLLLPERSIGLSAHDFQQAVAAPEVWITRSIRADGAETVPSRWLNRLRNLLDGLPERGGTTAVDAALTRGNSWLAAVRQRDSVRQVDRASRPAPRPPVTARPRSLRVTEVQTLKRDPYAIYARYCLRLSPLGPLAQTPDALLRGTVLHDVMEAFVRQSVAEPESLTADHLRGIGAEILASRVPWPAARALWQARLDRIADWFVGRERVRQTEAVPTFFEDTAKGLLKLPEIGMDLRVRADRIDIGEDGAARVYDYKSGSPPSPKQLRLYDKQLLIEALMLEDGSFEALGPTAAAAAIYIGLGPKMEERSAALEDEPPAKVRADLLRLLGAYLDAEKGYAARNEAYREDVLGDYDHLARFGEWDGSDAPVPEDVG